MSTKSLILSVVIVGILVLTTILLGGRIAPGASHAPRDEGRPELAASEETQAGIPRSVSSEQEGGTRSSVLGQSLPECLVELEGGGYIPLESGILMIESDGKYATVNVLHGQVYVEDGDFGANVLSASDGVNALSVIGSKGLSGEAPVLLRYVTEQVVRVFDIATGNGVLNARIIDGRPSSGSPPPHRGIDDLLAGSLEDDDADGGTTSGEYFLQARREWGNLRVEAPGYDSITRLVDRSAPRVAIGMARSTNLTVEIEDSVRAKALLEFGFGVYLEVSSGVGYGQLRPVGNASRFTFHGLIGGTYRATLLSPDGGVAIIPPKEFVVVAGESTDIVLSEELSRLIDIQVELALPPNLDVGILSLAVLGGTAHADGTYLFGPIMRRIPGTSFMPTNDGTFYCDVSGAFGDRLLVVEERSGVCEELNLGERQIVAVTLDLLSAAAHQVVLTSDCLDRPGVISWQYASGKGRRKCRQIVPEGESSALIVALPEQIDLSVVRGSCASGNLIVYPSITSAEISVTLHELVGMSSRILELWVDGGPLVCSQQAWYQLEIWGPDGALCVGSRVYGGPAAMKPVGPGLAERSGAVCSVDLAPGQYSVVLCDSNKVIGSFFVRSDDSEIIVHVEDGLLAQQVLF